MIIVLNTAAPTTTLGLYGSSGEVLQQEEWESGRQLSSQLLSRIESLLNSHHAAWDDLKGIVVFRGPGSFTGLRIGITVANTISYAKTIPIVGETGENWISKGIQRLAGKADDRQVLPHYGAPPNITKPRGTS